MNVLKKHRIKVGFIIWLTWVIIFSPHPLENLWGKLLVLFAPLVIVPLIFDILKNEELNGDCFSKIYQWQLPSALLFTLAYSLPQNTWAGILSLPWFLFTIANFIFQINFWRKSNRENKWIKLILSISSAFLVVGSIWAIFDRFGIRPLDYDPEIVFLTVAHFHYAGYVLPTISALAAKKMNSFFFGKTITYGIIAGIALVAVGIVNTQLGGLPKMETFAAWWLTIFAMLLAGFHIYFSLQKNTSPSVSLYWALAGVFLLMGMALAGLYGMRHIWTVPGLDIVWMRALHGSANVFGFSLFSILGWRLALK